MSYEIYLHELTVRTSHVDDTHAYLHGPSYLMSVLGGELSPQIEFRFPPLWSALSTSLEEVDPKSKKFIYQAATYDELIDCPVEIGCHETDGFMVNGVPHHIANYGVIYPHTNKLKEDMQKVVTHVANVMGDMPFEKYLFITHFAPKTFGGLEHLNSTALQFDGRRLMVKKDYQMYLSLVAHEYFHAWNVKRIRPRELGPFDYRNEAYTTLLWLAEGLTSFVDDLFVYQAGLSTLEEYLAVVKGNLDTYLSTPGRRFHSLELSSFNAWIKLYRPDENSKNSSVSYYLKGGLVFMCLHAHLLQKGKSVKDLLKLLWEDYKKCPDTGLTKDQVYSMVETLGGLDVLEKFQAMVETTEEIDFDSAFRLLGLELVFQDSPAAYSGAEFEFSGDRAIVKTVLLDSPAAKCGLNVGDEILALNNLRVLKEDVEKWGTQLLKDTGYKLTVSRLGKLTELQLVTDTAPRQLKEIKVINLELAQKALSF
jgi:predicted metalloprotease with PDZ domain